MGIDLVARDRDPLALLDLVLGAGPGLTGFRFFHDHDLRVLDRMLPDPRVAKIILSRNPLDSYVSWKIAQATGQWKLTNVAKRKEGLAEFDADEFAEHLDRLQGFQITLLHALQTTGQTAFYLDYEDLQDLDVMNGLAAWLGVPARLAELDRTSKAALASHTNSDVVCATATERHCLAYSHGHTLSDDA
jgi:LPS sulfotransferase NodH